MEAVYGKKDTGCLNCGQFQNEVILGDSGNSPEAGEKRRIRICFHVTEDGSVTNFLVLQSAGSVFGNEVTRMLKRMPKSTHATKAG